VFQTYQCACLIDRKLSFTVESSKFLRTPPLGKSSGDTFTPGAPLSVLMESRGHRQASVEASLGSEGVLRPPASCRKVALSKQ
jgi:hypothetical protein